MQSQELTSNGSRFILQVYVGALSLHYEALSVEASKQTSAEEIVACIVERLNLPGTNYELAEVAGECKERRLSPNEKPVSVMLLWPMHLERDFHRFYLREAQNDVPWLDSYGIDPQIFRDFIPFLLQPENREYPDLCQLPDLNESTLLENLQQRFEAGHIYTYVGSILIAVNPFKFHPIYNPKYVRLYQNQRVGPILPPHIFAIADNAYYCMLKEKRNQCVVISGESGSGKTESTNFLLHHLTALSQKGLHGSGVEQTILSAGPVLEAFGNAKTAHNNNSSRFGKFIQVNYRENGMVQGAVVQKYLLEKSRIVSQGPFERNYHVFYYLLSGASEQECDILHLLSAEKYCYLNAKNLTLENCDEKYEFSRLKQSMEMVGFSAEKQRRLFNVLSAVLLLGNIEFFPKKSTYHHDESVQVRNLNVVAIISELLKVKHDTLLAALTSKRVKASGETLIMQYKLPEAIAARDALAKCLYGALFDWIVLQVNHALLNKDQVLHSGHSIGVLDIFGFEDFGSQNSFEQLCINYANEHLQYYFNLHVFKYEQNEYKKEGIKWRDIDFMDNYGCLQLFESKPPGLLCILDDLCNFPGATNETLLQKFNSVHKDNKFYEKPQKKENAFIIKHYAGKVKYQVTEMREKNLDLMRQDIVSVLKNSSMAFVRELVGADPVAVFRWAIIRAFFRGYFAFRNAGIKHRKERNDQSIHKMPGKHRFRQQNDLILSHLVTVSSVNLTIYRIAKNKSFRPRERPKKGLKNLQTVKTLTAGQNLSNQSSVKTRKQPLTVTAQFQSSLSALMETLNQANPFFIRCIKSNPHKIPNKFDEATVIRQLRYTGMLETVRIRRAGYNVRLTYEEFIQLYRILLPKGLVSSQKDVRDFMNAMDLNKQHYQLGISKIYMRESQKMRLDVRLHTKIIDSIVMIQRWFKCLFQKRKYATQRSAAITIQMHWRLYIVKKQLNYKNTQAINAAIIIQSAWRMFMIRKWYNKLRYGIIIVQAHIRGKLARINAAQKATRTKNSHKERHILRSTQSLPVNEQPMDILLDNDNLKQLCNPHHSVDSIIDHRYSAIYTSPSPVNRPFDNLTEYAFFDQQRREVLNKAENQFRSLIISSTSNNNCYKNVETLPLQNKDQPTVSSKKEAIRKKQTDDSTTDGRNLRAYDLEKASRKFYNDMESRKSRFDARSTNLHGQQQTALFPNTINETITKMPTQGNTDNVILRSATEEYNTNYPHQSNKMNTEPQSQNVTLPSHHQGIQRKSQPHQDDSTPKAFYSTPMGKAAALLGTISEDAKHSKHDVKLAKTRRQKSNISDDFPGTVVAHPNLSRQSPINIESLRRRNSDPSTNKVTLLDVNRGNDMYQSSTHINIAGHRFRKAARISKGEKCASCQESDAFVNEGHRCLDCKVLVHTKCIQNGGVKTLQCEAKRSKRLRKNVDKSSTPNSKYSGTREYTDSTDKIISDAKELQLMQDFITQKICKMDNDFEKPSEVDRVFKQALREFKDNLVAQYSVAHKQNSDTLNIKYRDLIANFEHVMETCCGRKDDFPLTMGVNAFRGFLNEFMSSRETEKPKAKRKKEKKRKVDEHTNYNGHTFQLTIINIPTACEICQLFLLWPIERGLVCQNCRLTCHKKCYQKSHTCNKISNHDNISSHMVVSNSTLFGLTLSNLCIADGGVKIPVKIEQLITKIEMHGLYAEGIYRKSGVNSKIRELKTKMSEMDSAELDYESYNVHVLANVLKSFLREMPEPLLSFDRYDDFLRASELSETVDRVSTLMSLIKKLPPSHHALLERLVFHLALVAQREQFNRMSASSLAIVFAPCVLRTNRQIPAQDSLNDIGRQTKCIETLITQKMLNVKSTLADIDTLDTAAHTATTRLSTLRSSKVFTPEELAPRPVNLESETEEMLLEDHIQEIKKEKAMLTSTLPSLARATSDDDLLSTDMDGEGGSLDDLSCKDNQQDSKERLDSSTYSQTDNVSAKTNDSDMIDIEFVEPIAVSYNLRDQNIDYIQKNVRSKNVGRDAFIKNSFSVPKSSSGSIATSSRWTGSQQNLTYNMAGSVGSDLQRQKPLAVRSMSSGYEQGTSIISSLDSSAIPPNSSIPSPASGSSQFDHSCISNSQNKDNSRTNNNRKNRRQDSLDDEPIMV